VARDARPGFRKPLLGALKDYFHILLGHLLSDLPMDDVPAAAVQKAAQVAEGAAQIDVGNVHIPMLVRLQLLWNLGRKTTSPPSPMPTASSKDLVRLTRSTLTAISRHGSKSVTIH
jgi:hypothetical protein